jgi:hypothetical protein
MIARHTYDLDDRAGISAPQRGDASAISPNRRVVGRQPGPGAIPVVRPGTQDLVGIVSAIDVPERIRDQVE